MEGDTLRSCIWIGKSPIFFVCSHKEGSDLIYIVDTKRKDYFVTFKSDFLTARTVLLEKVNFISNDDRRHSKLCTTT